MSDEAKRTKAVELKLDLETAADFADYLAARGRSQQALQTYAAVLSLNPHAEAVRRRYAELLFHVNDARSPPGTVGRGGMLLSLLAMDVVTEAIEAAYFDNLERLLTRRDRLPMPGSLVLALGSGRCGSTSLARALADVENVCATHENPPVLHWSPTPDQLRIHRKRFAMLLDRYSLVFDSAHWWLNAADRMIEAFDGVKMIGLIRDPDDSSRSREAGVIRSIIGLTTTGRFGSRPCGTGSTRLTTPVSMVSKRRMRSVRTNCPRASTGW